MWLHGRVRVIPGLEGCSRWRILTTEWQETTVFPSSPPSSIMLSRTTGWDAVGPRGAVLTRVKILAAFDLDGITRREF